MSDVDGIAYREAGDPDAPAILLLHGYPQSSFMWEPLLGTVAAAGWRALAPDLPGFGDSPPDRPGTWERHVEAIGRFHRALELDRVVLAMHDWGALIGLRWACDQPELTRGLVIASSGFFPDGRWHGMAKALRTPGTGEQMVDALDREGFGKLMGEVCPGIADAAVDEYWKAYEGEDRRRAHLDLYRSGDFEKLEPYSERLAALDVPVLLLWGEHDPFAPVAGAHRFVRELARPELLLIPDAGHFVLDERPELCAAAIADFLARLS